MARTFVLQSSRTPQRRYQIDYGAVLNPQQYAVVAHGNGPVLVVAGAGTGKTRTLTYRVAYLIENGFAPETLVLLTFTRKAAREMLGRASTLLDGRCDRVRGGTFHALGVTLLRQYGPAIGLPRTFSILDAPDSADVIDLLRTEAGLDTSGLRFPKKGTLQQIHSSWKNGQGSVEDAMLSRYPHFLRHVEEIEKLFERYDSYKLRHALVDYDDLLERTLELMTQHPALAEEISGGMKYVLVDEYQDTNSVQARLVQQFAHVHGNVMAVGDDAQSIYRFRGADPEQIFAFPSLFPGTTVLPLEENYRSTPNILHLANTVIRQASKAYPKQLFTRTREVGEAPCLVPTADAEQEADFVAQMLLHLREDGTPLHRCAVLFRSAFNAYALEAELNRRQIPYVKYGGLKLAEAAHVKDLVAFLKVSENPSDAPSWNRILRLHKGIGARKAAELTELILAHPDEPPLPRATASQRRTADAVSAVVHLVKSLRVGGMPLAGQFELVLAYYEPLLQEAYPEDYPKRVQDLEHLAGLAERDVSRMDFLSSLALDPVETTALEANPESLEDERPLILSTIHSAKGLEFDTVFLIHALDGILPSGKSLNATESLDEELRLFYVAITRAENRLYVSYPSLVWQRGMGQTLSAPSRFLKPLPTELLDTLHLSYEPPALPPGPSQPLLPPAP